MDEAVGVGPAERSHQGGGNGPTPEPRRRMSARRKQEVVLRLLRGEDLELVSREHARAWAPGVRPHRVTPDKDRVQCVARLIRATKYQQGEAAIAIEVLNRMIRTAKPISVRIA